MISLVVAVAQNGVIGRDGGLPWRLSSDLKHFKALTMGRPIVMGRLTHESIGKALPGRQNIVITTDADYVAPGCDVVTSPEQAIAVAATQDEVMVIGGSHVYAAFLPLATRIHLTRVQAEVDGDAFFPELNPNEWQETSREEHAADDVNDFDYSYVTLDRINDS